MKHLNGRYLRERELRALGVVEIGENVAVHETCVLADLERIRFGSNVRIDAFAVLSAAGGGLSIGDFVHVGAHCFVSAAAGVELDAFSGLSPGVRIFSSSDDYGGDYLTNPTVPAAYTKPVADGPVRLGRHVIVGAGAVVLPQVTIGEGSAVGAGAVVNRNLDPWRIYAGTPAKALGERKRSLIEAEAALRRDLAAGIVTAPVSRLGAA